LETASILVGEAGNRLVPERDLIGVVLGAEGIDGGGDHGVPVENPLLVFDVVGIARLSPDSSSSLLRTASTDDQRWKPRVTEPARLGARPARSRWNRLHHRVGRTIGHGGDGRYRIGLRLEPESRPVWSRSSEKGCAMVGCEIPPPSASKNDEELRHEREAKVSELADRGRPSGRWRALG